MRAAALIAALAVLAGATAAVQPAWAQTDDHGDTREEATVLEPGRMQTGEINSSLENDYFRIVVSDFVTLTVDITRTSGTQQLEGNLENSIGSILEAGALQRQVSPGTYYIRVSSFSIASYTIHANISAERTVSIVPSVAFVAPGASQLLTVQVHPPGPLPATARLTITTGGAESGNIHNAPATVDIPAGEIAANFSINLDTVGTTANDRGTVSIINAVFLPAQQTTVTVAGLLYTLSVDNTADTFTLIVGTQPDGTVNICNRTPRVEAGILASPGLTGMDCARVLQTSLDTVNELNLISSGLTTLQNGDFANLPHLESLELGRNSLALLPVNVFDGLSTLTRLNLGTNELESLPAGLFDDLSALEGLALDNNPLHLQDDNLFAGLSKLQNLALHSNNLQSPPAGLFNGLSSLESLDLRFHLNNPLTLPAGLFNDVLDTLMTLLLDSRHRARVSIEPNVAAITPNSSHNLTARLSTSLPADIRLTITASGNQAGNVTLPDSAIVTIPAGMTSATFNINLAGATVGDTGAIVLSNPEITYTDTSSTTLQIIGRAQQPGVFNSLVNTLDTDRNTFAFSVSSQPDTLVNICDRTTGVKIDIFDEPLVTETDCTRVPQAQLNTITHLLLESRNISSVEVNDFANLPNLFDLTLSRNNLASLPAGLFDGLKLQRLTLNHNRLTPPLPTGLFNDVLGTLTELNLGNQANSVDLRSTVSIEPVAPVIALNASQTFTVRLTPPSPAGVLLTITAGGAQQAGNVTLFAPANVTIPAGASFATFDITLTGGTLGSTGTVVIEDVGSALIYTDRDNMEQETTVSEVVEHLLDVSGGPSSTPISTFTVLAQQPDGTVNICNRTDEVRDAILANNAVTSGTNCATVLISELNNIGPVLLNNMGITTLRVGDFANLPNLQNLALEFNNLESPLEGVFDNLDNLLLLALQDNNLGPSLPAGLFNDLRNLQTLDMRDNNLESLPAGLFDGLSQLQGLFLDRNNLTPPLPTGLFDDALNSLTFLGLSGQGNNANLISTVSIEPSNFMIAPNATQTLTVRLTPPSPATVRLTILAGGVEAEAGNVTLPDSATVTIPAGMTTATFDITLGAGAMGGRTGTVVIGRLASLVYTDPMGVERENTFTDVTTSLVNVPSAPSTPTSTFTVAAPPSTDVDICGRSRHVLAEILTRISFSMDRCAAVPLTQLLTITLLDLGETNNLNLRDGDFANLSNLDRLILIRSQVTQLPPTVFNGLSNLTRLNLETNSLESLPAGVFDGLFNLQALTLTGNPLIPPLPVGLFNDVLGSLTELTLNDEVKSTVGIIEANGLTIAPGIPQTYTAQLIPASPAAVRLNIFVPGPTGDVMLPSTTVTIPAGMTIATFDIALTAEAIEGDMKAVQLTNRALLYTTGTNDNVQENTAVNTSLVNVATTARRTFTVGAPADVPTVEFTRNGDITSVNEPEGEDTLTIRFDYTIRNIPVSSSFTSLAVNFGTLGPGPGYVPTFSGNLPHAATLSDPSSFDNGAVTFNDNPAFTRYNFDTGFYFSATFSENIRYQISADDNTTDDDFNLGITSVVLSGGSGGNITIPGADILVPGGEHVTADGTTYAVQTITIIDAQEALPVVRFTRAPSTVTEGASGQFILNLGTVPGGVATVTYTLVVTGPNASAGDILNITSPGIEPSTLVVNGTSNTFTISNVLTGTIVIATNADDDPTDELVTLTISQIEIADIILGPDDLVCDDCDPPGALSITVLDNNTPTVTLTRNQDSVTEGAGTPATFTLALRHVPNGRSTVTFTVKITGSETISPNFFGIGTDGRAPGAPPAFRLVSSNADTTLILMRSDGVTPINIDNNTANFNVHITPINDNSNSTDEIITYAIDEILLPGLPDPVVFDLENIVCGDCDPAGSSSLSITVIDTGAEPSAPPAAAYDSTANITIIEGGGPAASAGSTLTLTNAPNSVATVTFELAGGTAHVASLTEEADIDFSVSGGGSPVIDGDGMGGTFTIPAGTAEAILTFTARDSTDSTGERITFTITGITFADEGNGTDIPALPPLTINITDPTRGEIDAFIADSVIGIGETTTITFTLSNIPAQVSGVDVSRTEFIFQGFLPSGSFTPDGEVGTPGPLRTSSTYNLTISDNITNWRIRGDGNLTVNVPPTALTDEGVVITLAITAKIASTLMVTYNRIRSFGGGPELSRAFDVTERGRSLMLVIMGAPPPSIPEAAYNNDAAVAITEGGGAIVRTLTLTNAPDNNAATVSFELGGGTAHVADLNQADIDFGVSNGGENLTLNAGGTAGTFTIPAGTPAADLSFTARADDDSTGEQLTFVITGIVFADTSTVAEDDLPDPLTINVTDITPGRIEVSVSSADINTRETTDITFALRNIPSRVAGTGVVAGVEFVFGGFPPPGDFNPNSGDQQTRAFMSAAYDLAISSNITSWNIADATGAGELIVNVPASALTDGAADIILTVTPKTTATLTATFDRARVYGDSDADLGHTINATGSPFTVTILLEPAASYDASNVVLIEGLITSGIRTLTLIDVPNADAIAEFTLADGVANGASVTTPDITIAVGGGADMLSLNAGGDGGTFRIPAGDLSTTIAFTIPTPADADTDAEVIAFTITEIDFADNESDIGLLSTLVIVVGESPCHRTPAVLTAIRNAIGIDPNNCRDGDITAAQLSAITGTLSIIFDRTLTSLRNDDFAGLTSLNQLHLNNNALTELPAGVFAGLTSLNILRLFSNALATLPANVFSGLTDLTELHLGSNDLERLEPGLFNDLTNLSELRLNGNNFTALDPGLFGILTSLTLLSLNRNSLATLPENIFAGLTNLNDLNLSQQNLDGQQTLSLPANLFQGLNNLTLLQLQNNPRLISLDPDLFDGLSRLNSLNLRDNPGLTSLDADLFDGLSGLSILNLSRNPGLAPLDADLFDGLSMLRSLNLNNTGLSSLPADLFEDTDGLQTLNLNGNPRLTSLDVNLFDGLSRLSSLDLDNTGLSSLPADLFDEDMIRLTTLRMRGIPNQTSLPVGFLDNVLFHLRSLLLNTDNRRTLTLNVSFNDLVRGRGQSLITISTEGTPIEAGLGARVPYTVVFGGDGTAGHFIGLSASGTVDITPGMASTTLEVTAPPTATLGATATITLGTPMLLYDRDRDGTSSDVTSFVNTGEPIFDPVMNLVMVDTDNDEQTLTIVEPTTPSRIISIAVEETSVSESEDVIVIVTLDQPLPEQGGILYSLSAPAGSSAGIQNHDVDSLVGGFSSAIVNANIQSIRFTAAVQDDNRIETDMEEGRITINSVSWARIGFATTVNNVVDFSIMDNDAINLTLGIEDNDDISVALIAGEYQVRMRESTTALGVIIHAEPAPIRPDERGVILDRNITAGLTSSNGTAVNGTHFTFPDLTTTYSFIQEGRAQSTFASVIAAINIRDNDIDREREFTLALSSNDRAANINTPPTSARVTIVPDTGAQYDDLGGLTLVDSSAASAVRTLTLLHAPNTDATVHFRLARGTLLTANINNLSPDIRLDIGGDGGVLAIDPDGMGGNFRIHASGDGVATLFFRDNPDVTSAGENIGFTITSITFDDLATVTDIGRLPEFTINISSGGNPVAIVGETIGTLSEAAPANTSSARFTLSIRNLPDDHGNGNFQLTIPQRDASNPRRPRVNDDYEYQHQVGSLSAVFPLTPSSSVVDIMIPSNQVSEDDAVDIVFTFTALDDNYDENEAIRIIFTRPVTFQNADPALNLTPSRSNFIIPIADDDQVEATLNKSDQIPFDVNELIPNRANIPSTFTVTIANAPDADASVIYTLTGGADEKYNAFLSTGPSLSSASRSVFTIREADIIGSSPGSQGGGPGMAKATIVILPLDDADGDDEDVTLIIHSILFANGGNHANLDGGDIRGAVNGSLTLTITDEDPRPDANYTPGGDISITKGDAPVERTLTLDNAPMDSEATVEFAFGGGTAGTGTESSITFSVSGGGNLAFNTDGTTGTFTIPANTAATILTFAANTDSTAGQLTFTITGITFDDNETITDIGPLAPLNINITDPTPARLMVSVDNSDLETGQTTDIMFALGNVPGRVGGVAVARTEFVFEGFPPADQFTPNSGNPAPLTFVSTNYNLTISNNIRDWSITGVSTGRLTVNVPASALTGRAATVTLGVTAKAAAMLTTTHVMTQVFDAGDNSLEHPFTNTGDLEFTIRRPDPTGVTGIEFDNNNVAESGTIVVTVTLDQPLPRDGTLRYMVLAGAAPSISANDVTAGFGEASVSADADSSTFGFTVDVADDNRIDAAEQEAGAINIISVAWEDGGGFPVNDSRTFTITDNDGISLTLGIEDNDDIPVTLIDGEYYQVRVRESIPTLDVSIRAEPAPDPLNLDGVILDRSITAGLMSSDDSAANGEDFAFPGLMTTYSEGSAAQAAFASVTTAIAIHDRDSDQEKVFTLALSSQDRAANINTPPNRARVTIVPDTEADYRSTSDLTIVEGGDAASAERTLTLRHAPSTTATVNFALSGGTVTGLDVINPDISLVVTGGESIVFDSDGEGGNFQIPAIPTGTTDVTLVFEDNAAVVSAGTTIVFTITDITFDDPGTVTNIGELPGFTIIINSITAPAAIVSEPTVTSLSEAAPANTSSARFTLSIRNLPADHGDGSFQLTIPQRNADHPERPRVGDDYRYQHQVGNLPEVFPLTPSSPVVNITIPSNQVSEGTVDIVFTFTAVDDNYDEVDEEISIMFTQNVTFLSATPPLTLTPSRNNFNISIDDDDQVEATLNKGEPAVDANNFILDRDNIDSTFALTITDAPDADAEVTYTLAGGAGKYTASLSDDTSLNSTPNSVFIIPKADITGDGPDSQGDGAGAARATIVISPLDDADGDDEDVTLTIHSITFTNGSGHGDLGGGDILGAAVNGSLTLTITDEDPRPEARYTSDGDISITEGDASTQRTLTLVNAPSNIATVKFTFGGGTVGTGADTESDINFRVSGGDLTFNTDGTTGTFTIPADTPAATLTFTANADDDSTGERILFTITGITFDDPDTITDIGPLAPLAIIITDPTPARLMVSVGNSDLEIGENTNIVFALGNVPERVRGVAVARTEFVFRGFPAADQFNPNSSTDAQRERTFRSDDYNLTISDNIFNWSITNASASTGQLTVSVPASELTGAAATVTLTVNAKDVAMLTTTHVMTQVFDAGGTLLPHLFTSTGDLEFTIRKSPPTRVDGIAFDNDNVAENNVAENENLTVTVTLNQPLPRNGTLTYTVLAGAAPSISTNDVTTGFNEVLVSSAGADSDIFQFTVGVADDNRIDAAEQEAGAINIISVEWEDGGGFVVNDSRTFTITDNDGITLTLDADDEVRDNAGTLTVTVNAAPNPIPSTHNGVILERTVTANFFTEDDSASAAPPLPDYTAVNETLTYAAGTELSNRTVSTRTVNIPINDDDDDTDETFTVNLGSSDNAVNLDTPNTAADVIIVPNTTGDYGSASTTIALAEASGMSTTRTLRLGHAPESAATVSFELMGGTVTRENFAGPHALVLSVRDGATGLDFGDDNSTGSFTVQSGDNEVTLHFEAPADFYGDDETITFFITGITFDDDGDDTTDTPADALPPPLTISITDVGAAATVTADNDDTGISELAPELDTAVIRVRLTDIPSAATTAVISFTLAGTATRSIDYTVTLDGSSTSVNSVTITKADIDGNDPDVPQGGAPGSAEATLTFRAINDRAGIEEETIELTIDSVMFFADAPESDLAIADGIEDSSQIIIITDRPLTPLAIFSVGEASVNEGDDALSDMPNFRITLSGISSSTRTSTVHYEFSDGFGATASTDPPRCDDTEGADYCAFRKIGAGSLTALTTQTGSFMFPVSSVSGGQPIDIFILPRNDDDAEDETVELEITSITVPQSAETTLTFNLASGNLVNSSNHPMSTARITINDSARFGVTRIEIGNAANIPESEDITVDVILNRPLRENARLRYGIRAQANSANSIVANDMEDGFNDTFTPTARVGLSTIRFTVRVTDDNRIEPTMEQGVIEILRLDLPGNNQVRIAANNTATFTIRDNDKISLSIAGATVSENIGTFEYTVAAIAAAVPQDDRVVLDRAVAATLISTGGSATTGGANADYDGLPAAIVFPADNVARADFISAPPIPISIINDGEAVEENFILALTSNDPAVEIAAGTASTITIAPDPRAVFNGTLTLTFTESDGPMTRTLNISNVPDNTTAIVSFGVSGGTASDTGDPLHDFILTVDDNVSTSMLTFSGDNTNVTFTIPADRFVGGSTVINLTFTPIADEDSESEEITFSVANLLFPSNPIYNAERQESHLIITINEGALQLRIRVFLEGALQ